MENMPNLFSLQVKLSLSLDGCHTFKNIAQSECGITLLHCCTISIVVFGSFSLDIGMECVYAKDKTEYKEK